MPYADADFFVAIANSDDRLNSWAIKVLEEYEGQIYTSILTLVELALISVRKGIPVERMIASVLSIAELKDASKSSALAAAHLIDHEKTGVFDSFPVSSAVSFCNFLFCFFFSQHLNIFCHQPAFHHGLRLLPHLPYVQMPP